MIIKKCAPRRKCNYCEITDFESTIREHEKVHERDTIEVTKVLEKSRASDDKMTVRKCEICGAAILSRKVKRCSFCRTTA